MDNALRIALSRIEGFRSRTALMLYQGDQGREISRDLEFHEQELASLDQQLTELAITLTGNPYIDESTWIPPVKFAYCHWHRSGDLLAWLKAFHRGLLISKNYFESFLGLERDQVHRTEIHLSNSTIGFLNTGEIENVRSISVNVSTLSESGHAEIAKAIKELTEAITDSQELSADERTYVLENLDELSKQAALLPNERAKTGVIKSLVSGVGSSLSAVGGLAEVWSTWGWAIRTFFGF